MVVWGDITKFTVSAADSGERWQTSCFTSGTILHIKCLCCNTRPRSLKLADTHTSLHKWISTHASLHVHEHIRTRTRTHTHTDTQTHIHTYTHTYIRFAPHSKVKIWYYNFTQKKVTSWMALQMPVKCWERVYKLLTAGIHPYLSAYRAQKQCSHSLH